MMEVMDRPTKRDDRGDTKINELFDSMLSAVPDDNLWRSKGARDFKHKKKRRKAANKSRKANRGR